MSGWLLVHLIIFNVIVRSAAAALCTAVSLQTLRAHDFRILAACVCHTLTVKAETNSQSAPLSCWLQPQRTTLNQTTAPFILHVTFTRPCVFQSIISNTYDSFHYIMTISSPLGTESLSYSPMADQRMRTLSDEKATCCQFKSNTSVMNLLTLSSQRGSSGKT